MSDGARIGVPPPRTGRLYSAGEKHVIPDEAMVLTWAAKPTLWDLINDPLDTSIDEYEEDTLTADQAIVAATVIRSFAAKCPEAEASALRMAADFLDRHGQSGHPVQVAL